MILVYFGDLGIKGGLVIDVVVCVFDVDGCVIFGLFVVGNVSVFMMGCIYFGVGGTIGLVFIFGFLVVEIVNG